MPLSCTQAYSELTRTGEYFKASDHKAIMLLDTFTEYPACTSHTTKAPGQAHPPKSTLLTHLPDPAKHAQPKVHRIPTNPNPIQTSTHPHKRTNKRKYPTNARLPDLSKFPAESPQTDPGAYSAGAWRNGGAGGRSDDR